MAKYFTFADRAVPVVFFEGDDAITVSVMICDETDKKMDDFVQRLSKDNKLESRMKVLKDIVGKETAEDIVAKAEAMAQKLDVYALDQMLLYIRACYIEAKQGNLLAASKGRQN